MAFSAIQIIEQQANAYFDNFANTLDDLQRLYDETGDVQALECRNRLLARYQSKPYWGDPASSNNGKSEGRVFMHGDPESKPGLNYFAPKRILQDLLAMEWFDKVSMDKKRFTMEWRNQLIEDLMKSEHRDEIAKAWANKDLRLQVKGHVMGALSTAGVLKKSALAIARIYYGTGADNTKEVKTLAKYMGDSRKEYYTDWIVEYVNNSVDNPVRPIEN